MFVEDLHLDGADAGAITWGDEIADDVRADAHVVVIGCGEAGLLAGIRLAQAGVPFTIVEKNAGPGGTWWENRYPGARVDIGSHFYCYSFEPADHWTEYFSQHPELRAYFERIMDKYRIEEHCRFNTTVESATFDEATGRWSVTVKNADGTDRDARRARGDQRRRRAQHPEAARHPRHGDVRGSVVPLGALGPLGRPPRQAVRADRRRRHAVSRSRRRSPTRSSSSTSSSAPRSGCSRTRTTTVAVPDGERWAIRHLPFYGRWFRFLTFYPAPGSRSSGHASTPTTTTAASRSARRTARRASCSPS